MGAKGVVANRGYQGGLPNWLGRAYIVRVMRDTNTSDLAPQAKLCVAIGDRKNTGPFGHLEYFQCDAGSTRVTYGKAGLEGWPRERDRSLLEANPPPSEMVRSASSAQAWGNRP